MLAGVIYALLVALLIHRVGAFIRVLRLARGQPGFVAFFSPFSFLPGALFPLHWRFNLQRKNVWKLKDQLYRDANSTVLVVPSLWPPQVSILAGDPEAIDVVNHDKKSFTKAAGLNSKVLDRWGPSILTTDGHDWRRHRRIIAPPFSEANNAEVWDETVRVAHEWFERVDAGMDEEGVALVRNIEEAMSVMTLLVISKAGFGFPLSYPKEDTNKQGTIDFYQATRIMLAHFVPLTLLPRWCFSLTGSLRRMRTGSDVFDEAVISMIQGRRRSGTDGGERHDLLASLLKANGQETGSAALTDQELVSDVCIFLLAGHETSANTLACVLVLLALHPEHQEPIFREALALFGSDDSGTCSYAEGYTALPYTLATLQEGLRVAGPVTMMTKVAVEDTYLPARTNDGERTKVFVPKGAIVRENISGVHYNGQFWPDPYKFDPARFLSDQVDRRSWIPFSTGSRGCIGRQFALAESVAYLALTLLRYEIQVPAHLEHEWKLRVDESELERRERIFNPRFVLTLSPQKMDLAFVRRSTSDGA